ncbi:Mor transcription activator family protein [Aeromonas sp.]|uniref:Mor transcription activator family protein n=1 Tax=Aeromonas sp. TaxID=647 RepID=UPI002582C73C|nr:Mor transcription activator family protein [Aeromonas sp.]MCX7134414.1 hypothetical protein [Aeromonas sp.]
MRIRYDELLASPYFFDAFKRSLPNIKGTTLDDLFSCIGEELKKQGVFSELLQASMLIAFCETFGGSNFYVPSGVRVKGVLRDLKMFKEFTGNNIGELSIKYRVSERNVIDIISTQRKLQKESRDHLDNIGVRHA